MFEGRDPRIEERNGRFVVRRANGANEELFLARCERRSGGLREESGVWRQASSDTAGAGASRQGQQITAGEVHTEYYDGSARDS
jgi:hypothetical protein